MTKKIQTVGIVGKAKVEKDTRGQAKRHNSRPVTRIDVKNIVDSINMTLHDYGIAFDFDKSENLFCIHDDVPSLLAQAQQEAVRAERERIDSEVEALWEYHLDKTDISIGLKVEILHIIFNHGNKGKKALQKEEK